MNKWWKDSVVYQIYPSSFNDSNGDGIGDIPGITEKIPYLAKLGIDVIWLCPVYKSPMVDNGYDISDYRGINPMYGTLDDFRELIVVAREHNIGIIMDLVLNHTSDQHEWFKLSKTPEKNKYDSYYIWRKEPGDIKSVFGGEAYEYDKEKGEYYFHLFAKEQPDLDWENPEVREEAADIIRYWNDFGVKGYRLDVIDLIGKEVDKGILGNGPNLHKYLNEMNGKCFKGNDLLTVGETWGATPSIAKLYSGDNRDELSMVFQFEHMTLDWDEKYGKWMVKDFDLVNLKKVFEKWQTELADDGWNSLFWNNHDLPRIVSRWTDDNEYRYESATMLAAILHFMKGTPYIYQGEEIGMTNVKRVSVSEYNDVEVHGYYNDYVKEEGVMTESEFLAAANRSARDNARTPMQWSASANAGFSKGKPWLSVNPNYVDINVEKDLVSEKSVFEFYRKLISFRKAGSGLCEIIREGNFRLLAPESDKLFAYERSLADRKIGLVSNFSSEEIQYDFGEGEKKIIISNYGSKCLEGIRNLKPYEAVVFETTRL